MISIFCRGQRMLPFFELWDMGTFGFQNWTFAPNQGNWLMNAAEGNPPPAAVFPGQPAKTDYHDTLISTSFWGYEFQNCAQFKLEFDLKLENVQNTSTEAFGIAVYYEATWHLLADIYNYNSFDWTHLSYFLPHEVTHGSFRLGFVGHGQNTSNINKWLLDNIYLSFKCFPPESFTANMMGSYCHLSWQPAPCTLDTAGRTMIPMGYNVYRRSCNDSTFQKLNNSYVIDTTFDDHFPSGSCFYYYITEIYNSTEWNGFLCESQPSDTLYLMSEGVDRKDKEHGITMFPNPVDQTLTIKSADLFHGFQLTDLFGRTVFDIGKVFSREYSFSCKSLENGIYFLKIHTGQGEVCRKIILQH